MWLREKSFFHPFGVGVQKEYGNKKTTKYYNNNKQRTMITRRTMRGLTGGDEGRNTGVVIVLRYTDDCISKIAKVSGVVSIPSHSHCTDLARKFTTGDVIVSRARSLYAHFTRAEQYRKGSTSPLLPLPESLSLLSLLLCYFFFSDITILFF